MGGKRVANWRSLRGGEEVSPFSIALVNKSAHCLVLCIEGHMFETPLL